MSIFKSKPTPTLAQQSEALKVEEGDALALFETAAARLENVEDQQHDIARASEAEIARLEAEHQARIAALYETNLVATRRGNRAGQAATKLREFVGGDQ